MTAHPRTAPGGRCALLTLGRLPVALEIARALHADGWRVVVAEPLRWHLCRLSNAVDRCIVVTAPTVDEGRYLAELSDVIEREGVTLVVPVSEEAVFVAALHGRLPEGVRIACPPRDALLALHDKWRFATLARELGLPVPTTALGSTGEAVRLAASGPHVIKPRLSCSGVGVRLLASGAALPDECRDDAFVVQRRLPGESLCAFAFVRAGAVRALVTYRSLLEAGSVSVAFERVETPPDVERFVSTLAGARASSGMLAFDFVTDGRGRFHAIECNPRATSGIHLMSPRTIAEALVPDGASSPRAIAAAIGPRGEQADGRDGAGAGDRLRERADTAGDGARADDRSGGRADAVGSALLPVGTRRQEFWSAFAEVEGRTLRGRGRRVDWSRLLTTRDVDWSPTDRKPALLMVPASAALMWRALRARRPIVEVTMADMGWHGRR